MLRLKACGWGVKRIARQLGRSHHTARTTLAGRARLPRKDSPFSLRRIVYEGSVFLQLGRLFHQLDSKGLEGSCGRNIRAFARQSHAIMRFLAEVHGIDKHCRRPVALYEATIGTSVRFQELNVEALTEAISKQQLADRRAGMVSDNHFQSRPIVPAALFEFSDDAPGVSACRLVIRQ
jgi:hypothetical protein